MQLERVLLNVAAALSSVSIVHSSLAPRVMSKMEVISLGLGETWRHGELQASDFFEGSEAQRGPRIVAKLLLHCERGIDPFFNTTPLPRTYQ